LLAKALAPSWACELKVTAAIDAEGAAACSVLSPPQAASSKIRAEAKRVRVLFVFSDFMLDLD